LTMRLIMSKVSMCWSREISAHINIDINSFRMVGLRGPSYEFIGLLGQRSKISPINNHVKPTSMSDKPIFMILNQLRAREMKLSYTTIDLSFAGNSSTITTGQQQQLNYLQGTSRSTTNHSS
jgi:hypothetical protein